MPDINKANRQVCDVDIRVLKTKAPFLFFDTANTTTVGLTGDSVYAMKKAAKAIAFANPMDGTMTVEAQIKPFKLFSLVSDGVIDTTSISAVKKTITATVAGKLTLPSDVQAGTVFVYEEGSFAGELILGTVATSEFTATTPGDIAIGSSYEVGCLVSKTTGVRKISFNNKKTPKDYYITMLTVEKDEDGIYTPYKIVAYKATPKRSLDLSFSSTGDPASFKIEFDLLEDIDGNVIDMIEEDEAV